MDWRAFDQTMRNIEQYLSDSIDDAQKVREVLNTLVQKQDFLLKNLVAFQLSERQRLLKQELDQHRRHVRQNRKELCILKLRRVQIRIGAAIMYGQDKTRLLAKKLWNAARNCARSTVEVIMYWLYQLDNW